MALADQAQSQSFLTNGLVAYYPLNGNANDVSGNGINGTVVSALPAKDRFGATNGCYSFNGNSQYIYAPADNLPSGPRTISLWFKANEVAIEPVFLGYGGGCGSSFWMGLNLGETASFYLGTHCGGYSMSVNYTTPPTNAWDQWVLVMDDVGMTFYLNGQMIGTQTGTTTTAVAGNQLGLGVASGANGGGVPYTDSNLGFLDGYLDDVRIYNVALSEYDVQQLYALELSTPDSPSITQKPQSQKVNDGANATFTVAVNGMPTLSYQWLSNNATIAGATASSYIITNVQPADAASYSVVVSNAAGAVTSAVAVLTVQEFPHAATAIAIVDNGFVVGFTMTDYGYGYTNTPPVRIIGGGGSGALATAVVTSGEVTAVDPSNAGSGYTNVPVVVIEPPFIPNPVLSIAPMSFLSFSNLTVGGVYQLQQSEGYYWSNQPVNFKATNALDTQIVAGLANSGDYELALSPVPAQAFATPQVVNGFIVGITVTSGGSGYVTNPAVTIVGSGSNATAVASISGGVVTNVAVTDPGAGYTNAPTVEIARPPTAAVSPTILPMVQLNSASLAPYDNYQIQFTPALGATWQNWNGGLFIPTSVTNSQLFFFTNGSGFFRLRYSP
jgi:hypothetical protein